MSDDAFRPLKRRRLNPNSQSSTLEPASNCLTPLPPAALLVSLPALLAHPPHHRFYIQSLCLSLFSFRKCLTLPALPPEIECRAWVGLAEIGMKVISGGLSQNDDHPWANGIEAEVEKAIGKGSIIAQKHPSLRAYKHHLSLLQAQLSQWQHKVKFARTQIRNLIASFLPTDPPHIVYSAHLALIALFITLNAPSSNPSAFSPSLVCTSSLPSQGPQDIHSALSAVSDLEALSRAHGHKHVTLLAHVLHLRILVAASMWADVPAAIRCTEAALGLSYEPTSTPKLSNTRQSSGVENAALEPEVTFVEFEDAFEAAMAVHMLIMAVVFYTHVGSAVDTSPRLSHLHALLDSGALDKFSDGVVEIMIPNGPPLVIETTHPRVLFLLAFLVSSTAKRDAVGRRPKRKVFATEGLATWETEVTREISFSLWAGMADVEEVEQRLARIKADLLCELTAVSIMRSEFDTAENSLDILIAHTRTYAIFPLYAARIALHHGHLAHALGQTARALDCYRVAAHCAEGGSYVQVVARAGEIALGIAMKGRQFDDGPINKLAAQVTYPDEDMYSNEDKKMGLQIVKVCRGMGGTLEAVGHVIEACLTPEILRAKQHLKVALDLASKAQDNHLRALVLAQIASHYFHTAGDHAIEVLQTCEQLAAGLGAPPAKLSVGAPSSRDQKQAAPVVIGNAPLGLWVGERFLELFKRSGKETRVKKQSLVNAQLTKAVENLARRGMKVQETHAS
ncbi:hypothetical protein AcV5_005386 [Taiwanofungus camphoratus]|nr:hypothetical protein AcV5_005386 [Antrodia cinnamomea]